MTITKAKLSESLTAEIGLNKRESKELVNAFFENIIYALEHGNVVKLSGFGSFSIREKAERMGRNPRTGAQVKISARRAVSFKASQKIKANIVENTFELTQKLGRG